MELPNKTHILTALKNGPRRAREFKPISNREKVQAAFGDALAESGRTGLTKYSPVTGKHSLTVEGREYLKTQMV